MSRHAPVFGQVTLNFATNSIEIQNGVKNEGGDSDSVHNTDVGFDFLRVGNCVNTENFNPAFA